jgi:membrane protease YdiL (CAAX protease family)
MLAALAASAPSPPVPAAAVDDASVVIIATYLAAAFLFAAFWVFRAVAGKSASGQAVPPPVPVTWPAPLEEPLVRAAEDSPYAPPAAPQADPPPAAPQDLASGLRLRVPTTPYRALDLPLIGLVFLLYFALTAMPAGADPQPLEQKFGPGVLIASIIFQLLLMGMVAGFVVWRVNLVEWLGLRWKSWPLVFAIAPLTVFFMWCFMGALFFSGWNAWLERSLGIESMQDAVKLLQEAKDPLVIGLMAVAAVIVAPVAEEVVFRGYLYPAAKRFCGPAGGMLFSSLVFAAAHGNVVALLPLFVLAVLLCLIYEFTGSLWACISVHFLFNAATVTMQLLARSGAIPTPE